MLMAKRIVITGAPSSGKTECFERLKKEPEFENYSFFDELARKLLDDNPNYRDNWTQFHIDIYNQQTKREDYLDGKPFITDRGTVDAFAFHPETAEKVATTIEKEYLRYDAVLQLASSANLGEKFYQKDSIRFETVKEALEIEKAIKNVWKQHPSYIFIEADIDFENKYAIFLMHLKNIIT